MGVTKVANPGTGERKATGAEAREQAGLPGHARWHPVAGGHVDLGWCWGRR
jgi:hypothetical protein